MWTLSIESLGPWPLLRLSGHLVQGLPAEAFDGRRPRFDCARPVEHRLRCDRRQLIDSTGTGVLVSVRDITHRAGGRFILCAPSKGLLNVLTTTHLMEVFEIVSDETAALETLQAP